VKDKKHAPNARITAFLLWAKHVKPDVLRLDFTWFIPPIKLFECNLCTVCQMFLYHTIPVPSITTHGSSSCLFCIGGYRLPRFSKVLWVG
jgi:hypothetical protein